MGFLSRKILEPPLWSKARTATQAAESVEGTLKQVPKLQEGPHDGIRTAKKGIGPNGHLRFGLPGGLCKIDLFAT